MHPRVFLTVLVSALLVVSGRAYVAQFTSSIYAAPGTSVGELTPASNVSSTTRSNDQVRTLALQPDGKLVVAGLSDGRAQNSFALARYQPDGSLDASFGTDGKGTTRIGTDDAEVTALALQADGKIIAAGRTYSATDPMKPTVFALVRYQPDGRVDPSFGTDGIVTTPTSLGPLGTVSTVALQADGKIVVLVRPFGTEGDFFLFRYLANGGVDIGFGTGGRVTGAVGFHTEILALALQADGTLLVAGTEIKMIGAMGIIVPPGVTDFCPGPFGRKLVLARYTADGSLDPTFGSGGVRIVDLTTFRAVRALALQPDGKVVVAGDADCHFALARYYADGRLDTTFGIDGIASSHKGSAVLFTVTLQPDGNIIATGVFYDDLLLVRYTADGRLDTSFGTNGTVTIPVTETHALAAQPDGKIVVAGAVYDADYDFALVRYDRDGNLDAHFGTAGTVATNFATLTQVDHCETAVPPFPQLPRGYRGEGPPALRDAAAAVALQPDGKIVVAGTADYALALLRYQPDGTLDPSFGKNGVISTRISTYEKYADLASVLALQPDGKLVVAGATWLDAGYRFFLVRYHPDGRLDTDFGTHGIVTSSIGTGAAALALQPDGAVVAVIGASGYGTTASLVRFRSDGSLDPSFGSDGTISTGLIEVRSSMIQPDGKLVIPGFKILEVTKKAVKHAFVLVRYHLDGHVDPSFGVNGTLTLDTWQDTVHLSRFVLQPDSKIVGGGFVPYPEDLQERAVLARYHPDGRIDTDFGTGGKVAIPTKSLASARVHQPVALMPRYYCSGFCQIGLQGDGKILAAGSPAYSNITLSRYQSDGSLDSGFGDGGTVTTTVGSSGDILGALSFQSDGKIVVAGTCANARHTNMSLVRYNPDGSLDLTFARDGKVTTRIGTGILGR